MSLCIELVLATHGRSSVKLVTPAGDTYRLAGATGDVIAIRLRPLVEERMQDLGISSTGQFVQILREAYPEASGHPKSLLEQLLGCALVRVELNGQEYDGGKVRIFDALGEQCLLETRILRSKPLVI